MDSSNVSGDGNFAFAFNNAKFSDRLLRIEITGGGGGKVSGSSIVDLVKGHKCKRRTVDFNQETHVLDLAACHVSDLNKNLCESNNKLGEAMVMSSEDENEFSSPLVPRVKKLHISSPILAAKSPFFYKLFSNGMLESEQKDVTLNVDASEEDAVMELLNFMYSNSLSVTTAPALLDVLMAADKFEVASCMKYCSSLLLNMPMTVDFALLLLDLPSSMQAADSVKPLENAARQFIASHFKDINKGIGGFTLVAIEAVLASDDLQVKTEDVVYDIVLKWAKAHYSNLKERQEILGSRLARYIRFPHMSFHKLRKILTSNHFRPHVASSLVLEALFLKGESMNRQRSLADTKRAYKYSRPIQTVEFLVPRHRCIVYLDLKHQECAGIYPSGHLYSEVFYSGGQGFFLSAVCNMDKTSSLHCFGLYIWTQETMSGSLTVDYEFSARSKPARDFLARGKGKYKFTAGNTSIGYKNLFLMPWESFIANDCRYFINDVLHLRAELSISR